MNTQYKSVKDIEEALETKALEFYDEIRDRQELENSLGSDIGRWDYLKNKYAEEIFENKTFEEIDNEAESLAANF